MEKTPEAELQRPDSLRGEEHGPTGVEAELRSAVHVEQERRCGRLSVVSRWRHVQKKREREIAQEMEKGITRNFGVMYAAKRKKLVGAWD